MSLSGPWQKCTPSSASASYWLQGSGCLDLRSMAALRQQEALSRRAFCQYSSTSHVILSQCDVSVRSSCWQCSEFITLTVQWWTMKQFHLFPHQLHWWIWTDCFTGEWRFTGETFSSVIFFVCQWRIANTSLDCNWAYVYCQDQILRKMDRDPYQEWWMWS